MNSRKTFIGTQRSFRGWRMPVRREHAGRYRCHRCGAVHLGNFRTCYFCTTPL